MTVHPWIPTRRRLIDTLLAAIAPVSICVFALGGLSVWAASGNAGSPPRIGVTHARLYVPFGETPETAAFFRITNTGDAPDRLVKVTSPAVTGEISFSRHRMTQGASAHSERTDSLPVPGRGMLDMSPHTGDVIVPVTHRWKAGDLVPFTLYFAHAGRVETLAVVVRPGQEGV
ncbi:copper chaperone PCu(A)C [Streptomyces sp. SID2888]|uniref:copper chaperone PCu(A)C n=1 Tax=Streptomyces sp. SID2888 TaxID=2690256 RepID=UPI00136DB268|nr:copper chaperone PCu(A)C [Streptomyces sp. SID2888]MYV48859.1 copper chaperone PCu(A)C [Streptomyces sp. SID2888]